MSTKTKPTNQPTNKQTNKPTTEIALLAAATDVKARLEGNFITDNKLSYLSPTEMEENNIIPLSASPGQDCGCPQPPSSGQAAARQDENF